MNPIIFFVPGDPQPGGSKRAFYIPKLKRSVITEANPKAKNWRSTVAQVAAEVMRSPLQGALSVRFEFFKARPKGHYNAKGILRPSAPAYPTTKPDTTKLVRSTEDALKGIAWRDDSQVVDQFACKRYGDHIGCKVTITEKER